MLGKTERFQLIQHYQPDAMQAAPRIEPMGQNLQLSLQSSWSEEVELGKNDDA